MANQLVWQDQFNIGVDVIDSEHKKLFSILNRLFMHKTEESKRQWVCQEGIKYFKDHAMKHFADEEQYMASIDYPGFEIHRHLHDNFRRKTLPALEKELMQTAFSPEAIDHFLGVCAGWLLGHTMTEDRAITGKVASKWGELLPEELQDSMKQMIMFLLSDMFRLKAQVVSDCYGGERFGNGVYYRLIYGEKKGERWQLVLAFEEKLLVRTIGSLMGNDGEELNVMLINIARYMAQQFAQQIKERYPHSEKYEMIEENLLSYEQFQKKFENERPQSSLLFDTGEGYFAYCVFAPELFDKNPVEGAVIKAENAVNEIDKYLKKNKKRRMKKILVVDDSVVVREAIMELLKSDYEVELANSGIMAIKCISLDKPDLVLLDYEMPVCNGSQILEMIRSEEEFADIPVIFLTGNTSRESVKKVISLKPAGYLIKSLKQEEIKKNIDEFFKKKEK